MKNFTRFLALTLAILFAVGTISVAATQFPDVDESNPYAKEIDVVTSMGIVAGVKNAFSDGKVARWQFTVYAAKALTGETSDDVWTKNENNTTFEDLASRTAPAAVSWAVSNDLIKGRSNTEFDPYTTITLAEASAIMVRALGYDYDVRYNAEQPNAWKWAYLTKAMELGITKGLEPDALSPDHELTKSEACLLIYNTLFITRKNGSTVADRIWGGVAVDEDAVAQQFIITAVKTSKGTDQLANIYALHNFSGVKLNGFADGKVDEDITLYLTSDEFKALTGVDAETVRSKGYVGASLDALYAADGQEIEELTLNTPEIYSGLVAGGEFDTTAKTLTVNGVTFDFADTDYYVAKSSTKGYPALRDPAVYKMSEKFDDTDEASIARTTYYGVGGQPLFDYVGNKFFIDIDNNIVAENVHDTNSVAYIGVIVSGQYGKFASSAEIWYSDDSEGADDFDDGNYRVATEADLAKAALVDTIYERSAKANESTFAQAQTEIKYGKYTVTAFDDDGDGVADRIFIAGSNYKEIIARIGYDEEHKSGTIEYLTYGVAGVADADTRAKWTVLLERDYGNGTASKRDTFTGEHGITVDGTTYTTLEGFKKAGNGNEYFVAMMPVTAVNGALTAKGKLELVEWIPYEYGQIVNLAEIVNPSSNYTTTGIVGIMDRTTGVTNNYYVDINPKPAALKADNAVRVNHWAYVYDYDTTNNKTGYPVALDHEVYVGVAKDVEYLAVDAVEGKTLVDRSTVVSQWVKFIHLPVEMMTTCAKVNNVYQITKTETKDMILAISKSTTKGYPNAIYVSSTVTSPNMATFSFYDTTTGKQVTLDNVSLYDTVFNNTSLAWLYNLKSNLANTSSATANFAHVSNPEAASVAAYKGLSELWASRKTHINEIVTFAATADTALTDGKTYYTRVIVGGLNAAELEQAAALDAVFANTVYMEDANGVYNVVARANAVEGTYYTFAEVGVPDVAEIGNYFEKTTTPETVVDRYENLLYLTFTKDVVGDFYTVSAGTPVNIDWKTSNLTKAVSKYDILKDYYYLANTASRYGYVLTEDVDIDGDKTYYTLDGDAYTAVEVPDVGEIDTYYEYVVVNPFAFVKGKEYSAAEISVIYRSGDKYNTSWNTETKYTFDDEKGKFTTAYNTSTEYDVYTVPASRQIGDYLFSSDIAYTVSKHVLVYKYSTSSSVPFTTALYNSLTDAQKALLTKTDNSFERYSFVGAAATNTSPAVNSLAKTTTETKNNVTTKTTYRISNDADLPLKVKIEKTNADTVVIEYVVTADGIQKTTYGYDEGNDDADHGNQIGDQVLYAPNASNGQYKDTGLYKIDSEGNLYLYTPAIWGAGQVTTAASLTKIAKLSSTELGYFTKSVSGYKATENFISVGNATQPDPTLANYSWNLKDTIEKADHTTVNLKKGDSIVLKNELEEDLFTPTDDESSPTGYPELDKVYSAIIASGYGGAAGASGIAVEASEIPSTVKDKDNKDVTVYRYAYDVKGDKSGNVSFVKASGISYDGSAFNGMMLIDGNTIGTVTKDTRFIVISAKDVKVADDGKSYTQLDGYDFNTYTFDGIQKAKVAAYQYYGDFTDSKGNGKSATFVFLFGNVIPGETGTVTLTELTHATVTGLELGVEKLMPVDTYKFTVTAEEGYPNIAVKINGAAQTLTEDGEFSLKVEKDKKYTITINATETPVDSGTVAVTANDATVTYGEGVEISGVKNLPVGSYTFTVTPDEGKPMISVRVNNTAVTVDADNSFTIEVEKDELYIVDVSCSDAMYVFISANFNSTVNVDPETGDYIFTWTTGESVAYDVFTAEKVNGAIYESYRWDDTSYNRIYTTPGIYTVKAAEAQFGTGKYQLLRVEKTTDPYYPKLVNAKANAEDPDGIFDFLKNTEKLKTGAYYGSEAEGMILFFDLDVTEYDLTAHDYQGKVSYDNRVSKQVSDFIFVSFTTNKGFQTINASKASDANDDVIEDDPTAYNFLPWTTIAHNHAQSIWDDQDGDPLTEDNGPVTATLATTNIDELRTVTFKYAENANGKIIVFVNTVETVTVKSAKASS